MTHFSCLTGALESALQSSPRRKKEKSWGVWHAWIMLHACRVPWHLGESSGEKTRRGWRSWNWRGHGNIWKLSIFLQIARSSLTADFAEHGETVAPFEREKWCEEESAESPESTESRNEKAGKAGSQLQFNAIIDIVRKGQFRCPVQKSVSRIASKARKLRIRIPRNPQKTPTEIDAW